MRILVVEDEEELNEILVTWLKHEHYAVDCCHDGLEAWEYVVQMDYDAVVLDIMMPGMNGLDLIRKMRTNAITTPVLFLTAKDSVANRVEGLNAGANDYLVKPFAFEELVARLRVITRGRTDHPADIYTISDLKVDCIQRKVFRGGNQEIRLSGKEFAILEHMIRNKGIVLSKEHIERHIWDYAYDGDDNIVKVYIRHLRKKIDDPYPVKLIHTVRNYGYVLREEN